MADIFPAGPKFRVLPPQNGQILAYGNTSDENPSGCWTFQFAPDIGSDAAFIVMGRTPRISTADTSVPWVPIPYRRITVNNVASDYTVVADTIGATTTVIQVPSNGLAVGLLVAMTVGETTIYAQHMEGATAP